MKKLMMASMAALMAGTLAMPAVAQDVRARVVAGERAHVGKGPARFEDRQDRREHRRDRREDRRENRHDRREDRRDWRADRREDRRDWRHDRREDRREWRDDRRDHRRDWRDDRRHDRYVRRDDRRWRGHYWQPQHRYRAPVRYVRPAGYRHVRWGVGHRLPPAYYARPYYVDYRAYRLPPPPRGHHWVRHDNDVILVALATGLVLDVLYDLYY